MAFRSLLLCDHEATARLVGRVFRDLGVDMEHVTETEIAVEKIKQGSFDAVVVDDANPTGAALVLESASMSRFFFAFFFYPSQLADGIG